MGRGGGRGRGRGRGRGVSRPKGSANQTEPEYKKSDVFEANDSDPEEDKLAGKRYDRVDNYEYELPSDFEDEEIDEEEAFNSEDDRLYGHLFAGKAGTAKDSSEDAYDTSSDEDSDLLSSDEDVEGSEEEEDELDDIFGQTDSKSDEEDQAEGEVHEEGEVGKKNNDEAHNAMIRAVAGGAVDVQANKRKRRDVLVTEAYPESEFNLPASGGGELTLTDLIVGLGDSKAKLGAARKELERLERKAAPVSAPLPGPIRERQERRAGYEAAKEDVAKWMPMVKANREAPTLHFKSEASEVQKTVTTASIVAKHGPETAMETEVAALLAAAGAQSAAAVAEAEEALAMKALSVAEARERREKLAKMRALLFYHEMKAKRLKKIKSKEYRRRIKKSKERRKAEAAAELGTGIDGLMNPDELRREIEDAEFERAKERLTLKHKNTSRFIRRAIKRGSTQLDEGTKEAVAEQLRLGEELRQRVYRMKGSGAVGGSDDTDASDTEASSSDSEGEGMLSSKARASVLELLEGRSAGGGTGEALQEQKGLFSLPFMQRAMERRRFEAEEEARSMLAATDDNDQGAPNRERSTPSGRRAFAGSDAASNHAERVKRLEYARLASDSELESDADEDVEAKALRLGRKLQGPYGAAPDGNHDQVSPTAEANAAADQANGEFSRQTLFEAVNGASRKRSLATAKVSVGVTIGPAPGEKIGIQQQQQQKDAFVRSKQFKGAKEGYVFTKGPRGVGYYMDGANTVAAALSVTVKQSTGGEKETQQPKSAALPLGGYEDNEVNMRLGGESLSLPPGGGAQSQEELVRQAFAGDDVAAEFAADKAAEVESELPNDPVPGALPGWGTWATQKREPRWAVDARAKAAAKRAAAAASRKDAGLQYVVISEKWDKRNAKYRTPSVPYPFNSKETYERTMRQPLGREFNTDESFRNLTRPAVIKDAGVVIQPIRYSAAMADHSSKASSGAKRAPVCTIAGGMPRRAKKRK